VATACYARVGRRCDRLGEARVTVELLALCALGTAAMARAHERWVLVVLLSLNATLSNVLTIPTISRLYARDQRSGHHHGSASATALAVWAAFNIAGALGAASIAAALGTSTPFLVAAGLCLLSLMLEYALRPSVGRTAAAACGGLGGELPR
jgi:predicted MFS family arabinose efflux permease